MVSSLHSRLGRCRAVLVASLRLGADLPILLRGAEGRGLQKLAELADVGNDKRFSGVLGHTSSNRFNGFIVTPHQPVSLHQQLKFLSKTPLPMVLFQVGNILSVRNTLEIPPRKISDARPLPTRLLERH